MENSLDDIDGLVVPILTSSSLLGREVWGIPAENLAVSAISFWRSSCRPMLGGPISTTGLFLVGRG